MSKIVDGNYTSVVYSLVILKNKNILLINKIVDYLIPIS
jgi:hypothetical protein